MSAAATNNHHLDTPTLDKESGNLLKDIVSHGGYAYSAMSTLAAAGDMRAAEAAREMAWEQLHSGPWHSVLPVWRDAYSMACLYVAKLHLRNGEFKEALKALDMGLIMGGTLLKTDLESSVEKVTATANEGSGSAGNGDCRDRRLIKEDIDMAEVLRNLPVKSLSLKIVAKRSALSLEGFLCEFFLSGSPVVITDCMSHWPARTKWNNLDYLKTVAGDRTVPVEVGKNYLCTDWKQELIPFRDFLERMQSTNCSSADLTYLAQHPLFDQINELRKDILIPDYCFAGGGELQSLNAWFGPAGTVTPLHHDPHHNILAQVVGKKYIRLYSSSFTDELYPYSETMMCNSGQVDLDNIEEERFPKIEGLEFLDCILEEGEMLYIPPKWWHYVRSLTTSLSVSFWWSTIAESDS